MIFTGKKKLIFGGILAAVATVAVGGGALYYAMTPKDAPDQVTLGGAVEALNTMSNRTAATVTPAADSLTGVWTLAAGGESFVGYRVKEELATIGTFTAVGRTGNVTGSLTFDGSAITNVQVTADLTGLSSDNTMRDDQLRRQALETDTYPTATFTLTQPIALNGVPAEGETISATAVGDLTLHGVTRSVSIPLQGQLSGGNVVVVGSLDIAFADFGIQKPSSARVLSIEDRGVLELQLIFQQGTAG